MKTALATVDAACRVHRPVIAFSGGRDSMVLLDIVYRHTEHRPPVVYAHNSLMRPETLAFVQATCASYGAALHVAQPDRTHTEQWQRFGWPILGPLPAINWMQRYRHLGVRLNCGGCCRALKIAPGRKATKAIGCDAQFTGIRATDDMNRFLRLKDGPVMESKADGLAIITPLSHWTDLMVRRYHREFSLPVHPGEGQTGCRMCAGAWRYEGNAVQALRREDPEAWHGHIVGDGMWLPLLVVNPWQWSRPPSPQWVASKP
jgi:3'-phosphoadenosine 5'-phosphosulfate sulfotransferase (PAPS reductase)/FAD synthetase